MLLFFRVYFWSTVVRLSACPLRASVPLPDSSIEAAAAAILFLSTTVRSSACPQRSNATSCYISIFATVWPSTQLEESSVPLWSSTCPLQLSAPPGSSTEAAINSKSNWFLFLQGRQSQILSIIPYDTCQGPAAAF